jgi:oxepin-CoA hydrolase/3-oxo-5,6-dehydrosuberyl-CoA semialdehyde dehydrogenase
MIKKLQHYALGGWHEGSGDGEILHHAITGEPIFSHTIEGLDFKEILQYGRTVGNPALRKMTFQERGMMLKALAFYLMERKEKFYELSKATGATRADSWIDIEGGIGNLFAYASLRKQFPNEPFYVDGDTVPLSKGGTFIAQHIMVPKEGVAIHINAFNFPVWGMLEKIAVNFLAGVPAVVKPAEQTAFLTELVVREIVASNILPPGALQVICGYGNGLLEHLNMQDIVTFTGSAVTGKKLKALPNIIDQAIPFTMEADSLNATVLGEDAVPGTPEFDIFIKEVRKEITVKCGQKCTAVRRIIVPENLVEAVQIAIGKALEKTVIGDPDAEGVRMGALINKEQVAEVNQRIEELKKVSEVVFGKDDFEVVGADKNKGAFIAPTLMLNKNPLGNDEVHSIEAFGPVSTILPYKNMDEAIEITKRGMGSLCSSIVTADNKAAKAYVLGAASYNGRILALNADSAKENTGHGSPLPLLTHGGPGRAGGGEEMGGKRGVMHYLQRCAVQGHPTTVTEITNRYQYGGKYKEEMAHPFSKHWEELVVGETVITAKRTITEGDIVNFANVSWDHFYAHTDVTSLEGTTFEGRVAHGYFILSAAAGLFVQAKKGPVLLNYGLDECRFTKPVYAGMTIGVRLTVKEKIDQEKKADIAKGIVKFLVDVYDETGETVAVATILTMVKKVNQED